MFEKPGPYCPHFELYVNHLNPLNEYVYLFQRLKKTVSGSNGWYDNMVVGERTLGGK